MVGTSPWVWGDNRCRLSWLTSGWVRSAVMSMSVTVRASSTLAKIQSREWFLPASCSALIAAPGTEYATVQGWTAARAGPTVTGATRSAPSPW